MGRKLEHVMLPQTFFFYYAGNARSVMGTSAFIYKKKRDQTTFGIMVTSNMHPVGTIFIGCDIMLFNGKL